MNNNTVDIEELFMMARNGTLPKDFKDWSLADEYGWTVAHVAVHSDCLSKDFEDWSLSANTGWTVAHSAAFMGKLPKGFHLTHPDVWKMKDHRDISVEREAIVNGYILS